MTRCLPPVDPFLALDYFSTNQDYGTWKRDDEKPKPRVMNIAVFLDDVTAANGPLLFIPGCYKSGVVEVGHDLEMTSYPLWTLGRDKVTELAEQRGCVAATGSAGSMLMFSSLLVTPAHQTSRLLDERLFIYLFAMSTTIPTLSTAKNGFLTESLIPFRLWRRLA